MSKGLYSVLLGDTTIANMSVAIPASVFNNSDVRLRVWFNDGTTGSQLLTPDQRIASAGYAMNAANIVDGAITAAKIATGAVGSTQLATGAVSTAKIANGAVGATQMASASVGATQIVDASITAAKIGTGQVVKSVNGLTDAVTLSAGSNISITPSGNTLTLASTGGGRRAVVTNGTSTYYNAGNVGVGTSSPQFALDVNGSIHVGSYAANGSPKLVQFGDLGFVSIGENNADDQMELTAGKFVFNNGYVGIGTASPASKLHVISGTSDLPPRLTSTGTTSFAAGLDLYLGSTGKGYIGVPDASAGFAPGELLVFGGANTPVSLWSNGASRPIARYIRQRRDRYSDFGSKTAPIR